MVARMMWSLGVTWAAGCGEGGGGREGDFVASNVRYCRYCSIILSIGYYTSIHVHVVQYFPLDTAYFSKTGPDGRSLHPSPGRQLHRDVATSLHRDGAPPDGRSTGTNRDGRSTGTSLHRTVAPPGRRSTGTALHRTAMAGRSLHLKLNVFLEVFAR